MIVIYERREMPGIISVFFFCFFVVLCFFFFFQAEDGIRDISV